MQITPAKADPYQRAWTAGESNDYCQNVKRLVESGESAKITGLNPLQSRAIREVFVKEADYGLIEVTATTATFVGPVADSYALVADYIARTPGRAHPKASLHAVRRKLAKLVTEQPGYRQ